MVRLPALATLGLLPLQAMALQQAECRFDARCPVGAACVDEDFFLVLRRSTPIDGVIEMQLDGESLAGRYLDPHGAAAVIGAETATGGVFLRVDPDGVAARLIWVDLGRGETDLRLGSCGRFE